MWKAAECAALCVVWEAIGKNLHRWGELQTDAEFGPDIEVPGLFGRPVLAYSKPGRGVDRGQHHLSVRPLKKGEWVVIYPMSCTPVLVQAHKDSEEDFLYYDTYAGGARWNPTVGPVGNLAQIDYGKAF